ncbi:hypothetical protein [Nocardiopsis sp. NRRL B-16309]|uniref:hypothetical protein n=1 Tax=Nocardiopsis sp. NRRL B-16309 TaxID=1519494 RepID=UPI0006AF9925|nr:hypothetical protein [Nocardiopsis sp. NRRL B-16309]KOX14026.1 hypothetical protein ADL05_17450 [Nocardiopsis sp. NRRL B-16309]
MPVGGEVVAEYERLYSAAARMMWLEYPWLRKRGWSEERVAAWKTLEEVLASDAQVPADLGEPSDPTRHLLTRRGSDDRPLPLAEAARDWWTRIKEGRQVKHPGYALLDYPDLYGDVAFEPGSCVIVTDHWVLAVTKALTDLERRLAPGRPACVIGEGSAGLSATLHEIADHLRSAFTGQGPTPHPGGLPWIAVTPEPFTTRMDAARLERLRWAARAAADHIPPREQVIATRDRSVKRDTAQAAEILRRVLAGEEDFPWRERDSVDAAHDLMTGSQDPSFADKDAEIRRKVLEDSPLPRVPQEREIAEPPRSSGPVWKAVSADTTFVMAEILDEAAARLVPGRATAMIGYDAQTFSSLADEITTHLFNL